MKKKKLTKKGHAVLGKRYEKLNAYHRYIKDERAKARNNILHLVSKARLETVPCLCGSRDESIVLSKIDRWALPCREIFCNECGIFRVSPRWDDDVYNKIYTHFFWALQTGHSTISRERFELSVHRSQPFFNYLNNNTSFNGKKVVEIGCSYGAGLVRFKDKNVKSLCGYDWDEKILNAGREYTGLDLRYGGIDAALKDHSGGVDLIILRHVFEHFIDPLAEGNKLRKLVAPEGSMFIEVPGVLNPGEWLPDPMSFFNAFHAYSYCLRTLTLVLNQCGFELEKGNEHVYSLWKSGKFSNSPSWKDKKESDKVLGFIKRMEWKRKLRQFMSIRMWPIVRRISAR